MERNRISFLQSHGKALEKECCLPGVFCDSGDTPAIIITIFYFVFCIFYTPVGKDPRGRKLKKAKIKMSDGHRSVIIILLLILLL